MLQHKHLLIRAEVKNPPKNATYIQEWFKKLIVEINMKLLRGPIASYVDVPGNRGLTCVAIIETSHIAMHVWDETNPGLMQFDVYTCGSLDPQKVFDAIKEFDPVKVDYKYLDREHGFEELIIMKEFTVRYTVDGDVFESVVRTSSSGQAIRWVELQFPTAVSISVSVAGGIY